MGVWKGSIANESGTSGGSNKKICELRILGGPGGSNSWHHKARYEPSDMALSGSNSLTSLRDADPSPSRVGTGKEI
jgi:hypothetical protein